MPPVAPVASTTVSTITRRSWSTSCVAASASPKRTVESRMRARSASSSSSRASSWSAISLKAVPRRANSSLPSTSTRRSSRPRGDRVRGGGEAVERGDDRAADGVGDERDQEQRDEQADQQPLVGPHDRVVDLVLRRRAARAPACRFLPARWWRACGSAVPLDGERLRAARRRERAHRSARRACRRRGPRRSTTSLSLESSPERLRRRASALVVSGTPETSVPATLPLLTIANRVPGAIIRGGPSCSVGVSRRTPRLAATSLRSFRPVSAQERRLQVTVDGERLRAAGRRRRAAPL